MAMLQFISSGLPKVSVHGSFFKSNWSGAWNKAFHVAFGVKIFSAFHKGCFRKQNQT